MRTSLLSRVAERVQRSPPFTQKPCVELCSDNMCDSRLDLAPKTRHFVKEAKLVPTYLPTYRLHWFVQ
jgi:hypothetical protein